MSARSCWLPETGRALRIRTSGGTAPHPAVIPNPAAGSITARDKGGGSSTSGPPSATRPERALFRRDAGFSYHLRPFGDLAADDPSELSGRGAGGLEVGGREPLLHLGVPERARRCRVQPAADLFRGPGRDHQAVPGGHFIAGNAGLG